MRHIWHLNKYKRSTRTTMFRSLWGSTSICMHIRRLKNFQNITIQCIDPDCCKFETRWKKKHVFVNNVPWEKISYHSKSFTIQSEKTQYRLQILTIWKLKNSDEPQNQKDKQICKDKSPKRTKQKEKLQNRRNVCLLFFFFLFS